MTIRDIIQLGKICILTLISWCVSPRYWRKVALLTVTGEIGQSYWPLYRAIFGQRYTDAEIRGINQRRLAYARELKLQVLGLNGPWRTWHPKIQLIGESNLKQALKQGRGAVLWIIETPFSTLVTKMALHDAGYLACQLSRPGHGFSITSPFGMRFLNPLWTRIEDRFIAERILITDANSKEAVTILRDKLAANNVVNITLAPLAHRFIEAPFFNGRLQIPSGPIRLAIDCGAVLMPVFTTVEQNGFGVSVETTLFSGESGANIDQIAATFAKRLEQFVSKYPDQWMGWDWLPSRIQNA